jgi:hypothetical protein
MGQKSHTWAPLRYYLMMSSLVFVSFPSKMLSVSKLSQWDVAKCKLYVKILDNDELSLLFPVKWRALP